VGILVLDHRTIVREALATLLAQQRDLTIVGQADSPADAGRLGVAPDVIVTDIDLDSRAGQGTVAELRRLFPRGGIVVLTNVGHPPVVQAALDAGADGYLLKTSTTTELLVGIRAVAGGETYLQPSLGVELARWHSPRQVESLSSREEVVLVLLVEGHTNADIARRLGISLRTVETHRARLRQKLGLRTRADLFAHACQVGLIARPDERGSDG
jgi:two-component system response regulator NreC